MDRKPQTDSEIQGYCRGHLAAIVSEGLEPFPACFFELDVLLNAPVVDLKKVTGLLRTDARFSHRVLQLSNAMLLRSDELANTATDALVSLGPCLFHAAVLLCAVTEFGPRVSRDVNAEALWSHGLQIAIASEAVAAQSSYSAPGKAYVAGLLHDIGCLPLLVVAREQEKRFSELAAIDWRDNIALEREIFGLDHCQIGRWMAKSWKLSPAIIDAVSYHHDPRRAETNSQFAEFVCLAEHDCLPRSHQKTTHLPVAPFSLPVFCQPVAYKH